MFHTFNRLGDVQGSHPVDFKSEAIEDTLSSNCTFSDTQYCAHFSLPIQRHSSPGARSRRAPFRFSSLREARSKRDTCKVSERRASSMSHQFPSRGTPSRMHYASAESPNRSSMDDGQRVMQSPSYALPSAFVSVSRLLSTTLFIFTEYTCHPSASRTDGYTPPIAPLKYGSDVKPVWRSRRDRYPPSITEFRDQAVVSN